MMISFMIQLTYLISKQTLKRNLFVAFGICLHFFGHLDKFLNLPIWANFYDLTDLSTYDDDDDTTLDKPAILD